MASTLKSQESRYAIGRDGVFSTLYDRELGCPIVENASERHCRDVRAQLLVQEHDLDPLDSSFARLAPGHPGQRAA